jgi:hypothetical protein
MSTQSEPKPGDWVMEGRCPHGYRVWIPFDPLGYLLKPKDGACGQHRPVTRTERPSRFRIWVETRRARKALNGRPPWLSS